MRLNSPIISVVRAVNGRSLTAVRPLLRGFSTADAWPEPFFANVCSSLRAFCQLTSFSTARIQALVLGAVPRPIWSLVVGKRRVGVFAPVNTSRRSMSWQCEHKNV